MYEEYAVDEGKRAEHASPDDLTLLPIERVIKDVRACVNANISVAGLALALTIPDIMGERCYPSMVRDNGERNIRGQYTRWFDEWVARDFVDKLHWFTGETCYDLRCSLLHQGNADIDFHHHEDRGTRYRYHFALVDDGAQHHIEHRVGNSNVKECDVHVNADVLASAICDGAEACLRS